MKEVILSLRKFSLRWSIVIVFAATLIVGLFSLFNGKSLGLTAIITALTITLFYVTFAVQAIEKDEKAVITSCIFMAAMLCLLVVLSRFSTNHQILETCSWVMSLGAMIVCRVGHMNQSKYLPLTHF